MGAPPRYMGFNFPYACFIGRTREPAEDDFRWVADWGFNFVRLPLTYTNWVREFDPYAIDESWLELVDRCVEMARRNGIHLNICFHRAPGYSTARQREEPFCLWRDERALDSFCEHWKLFARRYRGVSAADVSFNLVNEPSGSTAPEYERVVRTATGAIRSVDPLRPIYVDGLQWGNIPLPQLGDLGIVQSCRAYYPLGLSHFRAEWEDRGEWPVPTWPGTISGGRWDRARLERLYEPWAALTRQSSGVHCGEGGIYSHTPHAVALAWLRDVLEVLRERDIGFALWEFRGAFGVLNSRRADIAYEDWHGQKLDRALLELLREFV